MQETPRNEFSVQEYYPDGTYSVVCQFVGAEEAVRAAHRTTQKPAVLLGIIQKVTITDGEEFCVFLWENGKGVVFPSQTQEASDAADI